MNMWYFINNSKSKVEKKMFQQTHPQSECKVNKLTKNYCVH